MSKNILFFTSLKANDPNLSDYQQYCFLTWNYYAKKHNLDVIVLEDPLFDVEVMRPTWQRWYVYDILMSNGIEYNQVALVDVDTMVRWDTPNIFELSEGKFTGVVDDLSVEWTYSSIQGYKEYFPTVDLKWYRYINNGMIVLPTEGGEDFCKKITNFYSENLNSLREKQHKTLRKGTDQTPVNYIALETFEDNIQYLSKEYNMTHMHKTFAFHDNIYIKCSYIWHFNGFPREQRYEAMKHTWEVIKNNYED